MSLGAFHFVLTARWRIFFGTPCTSWPRAIRQPLRSATAPMGLTNLADSQHARLKLGNATFAVSCRLIDVSRKMGVPIFLEIPDASLLWLAPRMRSLTRVADFAQGRFHQCQFGTSWKKCTRIAAWRGGCLSRLQRWCHADGKRCSRTGLPHQELSGRAPGGKHWTAIASAYPPQLCRTIASLMIDAAESLRSSTPWNSFKP